MVINGENESIKEIPYGISDYELIRTENYYYVDKTPYLNNLKKAGRYLFFIRPRRFGKSLFISLIESYFDIFYKDRFEEFFKGTWIYDHPTDEKGKYLVLSFDFSGVEPSLDKMEASFLNHVQDIAVSFIRKYSDYLSANQDMDYFTQKIKNSGSGSDILSTLLHLCKGARQKLYVVIDEYDNFSNTILSTVGQDAYEKLTHGPGFFRSFFNALKKGTGRTGAPVTRSFITGVSPITMDDVTSGYNIGKNVSLEPYLNRMLGFTRDDVIDMIEYYRSKGLIKHPTAYLMDIITQWYGNYQFCKNDDVKLFNPDMVLYFIDNYITAKELPDDLIDGNVKIDYEKLKHLIIVDKIGEIGKTFNGNFNRLKTLIEKEEISAKVEKGFPLEKLTDENNFISLLFYFGLLTIRKPELDELVLTIPNETIRRLFYNYIREGYDETGVFSIDMHAYHQLMKAMAVKGEWKLLTDYITGRMKESMSLRDLISGEKSIQAFLNVYLGLSNLYIIHSEKELNKGYADLVLVPFLARYPGIKYSYLMEIKYLKSGAKRGDAGVQELINKAEEQLKTYSIDEKYRKNIEKTRLIKLVLIFSGHEAIYIDECH
jgi:hypothetical protein